jgi:hypothetical protein
MPSFGIVVAVSFDHPCPDCATEMEYVRLLNEGDEEGRGSQTLYQCPKCKTVMVNPSKATP